MDPIEYLIDEIKDIEIDTSKTEIGKAWADNPKNSVTGLYFPKQKLVNVCSFCKKKREIYCVQGYQVFEGLEDPTIKVAISKNAKKTFYHRTFYLICESCAGAKVL